MSTEALPDYSWIDPDKNISGVLLSDAIAFYVEKANLIENHDPACIKAASYALRLGSLYYQDGKFGKLKEGEPLILKSNSLTFVSMLEKVNIPLYMIARFNLKIDLIYQGILLGTGPQVDPGFRGNLSCPLHNISNNDVELRYGERFATIDFIKTSHFPSAKELPEIEDLSLDKLYERYEKTGVPGYGGKKCVLFPIDKLKRRTLENYIPPGRIFLSSLKDFEKKFRLSRNINWGVGIALFAILLTLIFAGAGLWWNQFEYFKTLRDQLDAQISRNSDLAGSNDHAQQKLLQMESRIGKIESELAGLKKNPGSSHKPGPPQNNQSFERGR